MEENANQTITVPKEEAKRNLRGFVVLGFATAKRNLVFVGFVILGLATLVLIGWLAFGLFGDAWPQPKDDATFDMAGMRNYFWSTGIVAAGIVGTWGFALAAVRTHALNRQAKVAETDSKFSEKKHAAEAFATAIEQLGHEKYPVRLGAVYALEALAKSSLDLHGPIFETLCAYVREEAPAPKDDDLTAKIEGRGEKDIRDVIDDHLETVAKPDVVVQAILTVAGRRDPARDPHNGTTFFHLNLEDTDLRKADMRDGQFDRALFNRSFLCGANLRRSHLAEAFLHEAHLEGAGLSNAHLEGVRMSEAHLEGAEMDGTNLRNTYLMEAHLEGADLFAAHLEGANLSSAHLEGANLNGAHLKGAGLTRVSTS